MTASNSFVTVYKTETHSVSVLSTYKNSYDMYLIFGMKLFNHKADEMCVVKTY